MFMLDFPRTFIQNFLDDHCPLYRRRLEAKADAYFEKEAAVALDAWRDKHGLNMPSDEEIEEVARQICEEHGWPYNEKELP